MAGDDVLSQVEDAKAQHDMGVFAARVYRGARSEADSWREAFWATVAVLVAMTKSGDGD